MTYGVFEDGDAPTIMVTLVDGDSSDWLIKKLVRIRECCKTWVSRYSPTED